MADPKSLPTKLEQEFEQMKDDIRTIKQDVKRLLDQTNDVGRSDRRGADLYNPGILQPWTSRSPRHVATPDMMSDTASTASTGSEDESAKQHSLLTKCLSGAIRRHFKELVRCVPVDGVVDAILAYGIVTVQENERIREFSANDDKMRFLIKNVMSKDYKTMMKFLSLINEFDPYLRNAIRSTFDICYQDGIPGLSLKACTVCLMKNRINIKVVGDEFFARELVSNELHSDITDSASTEGHADLWRRLFEELSSELPEYILKVMKDILKDGEGESVGHHDDIIQNIDNDIKRHIRSLKCRCVSDSKQSITPLPKYSCNIRYTAPLGYSFVDTQNNTPTSTPLPAMSVSYASSFPSYNAGNKRSISPLLQNSSRSVKQRRGSNNPCSASPGLYSFQTPINFTPRPPSCSDMFSAISQSSYLPAPSSSTIYTTSRSPTFYAHTYVQVHSQTPPSLTGNVSSPSSSSRSTVLKSPVPTAYVPQLKKFAIAPRQSPLDYLCNAVELSLKETD